MNLQSDISLYCWRNRTTVLAYYPGSFIPLGTVNIQISPGHFQSPLCVSTKRNVQPELSNTQLRCGSLPMGSETTGQSTISTYQEGSTQGVSASWGCRNKVPQTRWFKTTEKCPLRVLEARILRSRCQQGRAPSGSARKGLLQASLQLPALSWLVAAPL